MSTTEPTSRQSIIHKLLNNTQKNYLDTLLADINSILNAKQQEIPHLEEYPEVKNSILNYGLPNFSNYDSTTEEIARLIIEDIKLALIHHEPRLINVEVKLTNIRKYDIDFTITATLLNDPDPIEIKFDSSYKPILQQFDVNERTE